MTANRYLLMVIILLLCLDIKLYFPLSKLELAILILIGLNMVFYMINIIKKAFKE